MNAYAAIWIVGQITVLVMLANVAWSWASGRKPVAVIYNVCVAVLLVLLLAFVILVNFGGES